MKKLLFIFDTDLQPSVFDTIVGYDGGADHVIGYGDVKPDTVKALVEGTIFTRGGKEKKNTAIFVGGSDINIGQKLFTQIQKHFFSDFKVSIMLDSNGSNTTAAAAVARLASSLPIAGKDAVILAGTGPVGQRAAALLAMEGCHVTLTSRSWEKAQDACTNIKKRFEVEVSGKEAQDNLARSQAIENADIVFAAGASGVELITAEAWQYNDRIKLMADANATPPLGIGGIDMQDKGKERQGKIVWGAVGFGTLKLSLQRVCIAKLFEDNTLVLDAEKIYSLAKEMAGNNRSD